jgi:very-short-patch-repair endonuclease
MSPQKWYAQNRHLFGSQFEHLFFENVLSDIPGLDFACLQTQMPFRDDEGKQRYCDFAIQEGLEVRIAIEVDGYDKRGTGEGMTHAEFIDWQRRQAALTSQGWHVLRFANSDVCNEPTRCRNNIHSLLTKLRQKEAAGSETLQSITPPHSKAVKTRYKSEAPTRKPKRRQKSFKKELKKMGVAAGLVTAVLLGFLFYGQPWLTNQLQAALPTSAAAAEACPDAIHWSEALDHMGETITTEGPIKRVTYKPDVNGSPTWLEIGARFPDPNRLTLLIWGGDRPTFEPKITGQIIGDTACVTGEVSEYRGDVQMQLQEAEQLSLY